MSQIATEVPSFFERLGGYAAIDAAPDVFYGKALADGRINQFFNGVDMDRQRRKQKVFPAYAFGAPVRCDGRDLTAAHAALVPNGLNDDHFDAVAGHLRATLGEIGVSPDLVSEVMEIAGSTRNAVLGR